MADRTLRGSRLGSVSYETDYGVDVAARAFTAYACPNGHTFTMPFAQDAEIPSTWECRIDGAVAEIVDGPAPVAKKIKPARTHWDSSSVVPSMTSSRCWPSVWSSSGLAGEPPSPPDYRTGRRGRVRGACGSA